MKKSILIFILLLMTGCINNKKNEITLNLKGELPKTGEVYIKIYGYDKTLADKEATLILLKREEYTDGTSIKLSIPDNPVKYVEPPILKDENLKIYLVIEIVDRNKKYIQDYDKLSLIDLGNEEEYNIPMKKELSN